MSHNTNSLRKSWWKQIFAKAPKHPSQFSVERLEDRTNPAGTITLGNASFGITQSPVNVAVTRTGDLSQHVWVDYSLHDGTAILDQNYADTNLTHTVVFLPGVASVDISQDIFDNNFPETSRSFTITLDRVVNVVNADAKLAPKVNVPTSPTTPLAASFGDINGDGLPDLVYVAGTSLVAQINQTPSGSLGAMTFGAAKTVTGFGSAPTGILIKDLNKDGLVDVVVSFSTFAAPQVLRNTTTPGTTTPSFNNDFTLQVGTKSVGVAADDFNVDGLLDLVIIDSKDRLARTFLNSSTPGKITFGQVATSPTDENPNFVTTGDINGDHKPDIIITNTPGTGLTAIGTVSVILNFTVPGSSTPVTGGVQNFTVGSTTSLANPPGTSGASVADFNGDGLLDIVAVNPLQSSATVLINNTLTGGTNATFQNERVELALGTNSGPQSVVARDFNGDGLADIATVNNLARSITLLTNYTVPGAKLSTEVVFSELTSTNTGANPVGLFVGDVNNDGKPDFVTSSRDDNQINVFYNITDFSEPTNGVGVPAPSFQLDPALPSLDAGSSPTNVVIADFNGDGLSDYATPNAAAGTISIAFASMLPGDTHPSYTNKVVIAGTPQNPLTAPVFLAAVDLNDDGRPDLVSLHKSATGQNLQKISVLFGNGAGFNPAQEVQLASTPTSVSFADVNGDGIQDLVFTTTSNSVAILVNTTVVGSTKATFTNRPSSSVGNAPVWIAAGDLNGDGKIDLVTANGGTGTGGNAVSILANKADASGFNTARTINVGASPTSSPRMVALGDVNGDGRLDIVTADRSSNSVSILLNLSPGGVTIPIFSTPITINVGTAPTSVDIADMNGDGLNDIVVLNSTNNTVSVLYNKSSGIFGSFFGASAVTVATSTIAMPAHTYPNATAAVYLGVNPADGSATPIGGLTNGQTVYVISSSSAPDSFKLASSAANALANIPITFSGTPTGSHILATIPTFQKVDYASGLTGTTFAFIGRADFDGRKDIFVLSGATAGKINVLKNNPVLIHKGSDAETITLFPAPVVTSFVRSSSNPTNVSQVNYTITFSHNISGLSPTNFDIANDLGNLTGTTVVSVTPGVNNSIWNVLVNTGTGEGTLEVSITNNNGVVDAFGNALFGASGSAFTPISGGIYTVDHTNPTATVATGPGVFNNSTSPGFSFNGNDPVSNGVNSGIGSFQVSVDSGAFVTFNGVNVPGIAEGSHNLRVRAIDGAGNVGAASAPYNWSTDLTAPSVSFTSTPSNINNTTSLSFAFTGSDPTSKGITSGISGYRYQLDGGTILSAGPSGTLNLFGLSEGSHTINVFSVDNAGNQSLPATFSWGLDITGPVATILTTPPSFTPSGNASFTFSAIDPTVSGATSGVNHLEGSLDGGAYTTFAGAASFTSIPEGSHVFRVRGVDNLGNVGTPVLFIWMVDVTTPTLTIDTTPPAISYVNTATFSFTAIDPNGTTGVNSGIQRIELSLDSGPFQTFTNPGTLTGLSDGSHTVRVRAVDNAGNVGNVATSSWITDVNAPRATITPVGPTTTNAQSLSFQVAFSVAVTGVTASNFALFGTGSTPATISAVTGSGTTWTVTVDGTVNGTVGLSMVNTAGVTDVLGGVVQNIPASSVAVTVDRVPPNVTAITPPSSVAPGATSVTYTVQFSERIFGLTPSDFTLSGGGQGAAVTNVTQGAGSTWTVTVAAGAVPFSGPLQLTYVSTGSNQDAAGNVVQAGQQLAAAHVTIPAAISRQYAVGSDAGGTASVQTFNADESQRLGFTAFSTTGGVRVASADFNGDGVADIAMTTGPGEASHFRLVDGVSQATIFEFDPFEASFTGGAFVAVGDVNGDAVPDIVVTPDQGGGPRVRIFEGRNFTQIADFFGIDDPNFFGGARAAVGDVNGDGIGDLIVAAGFGGGPRIATFDGTTITNTRQKLFADFFAFESTLVNGAYIAAGDVNGDGRADLVVGGGPGGGPRVSIFSGAGFLTGNKTTLVDFFAGDTANRGGIRVATKDLDGDNKVDLVVGAGVGADSFVTTYRGTSLLASPTSPPEFTSFEAIPNFLGGIYVG